MNTHIELVPNIDPSRIKIILDPKHIRYDDRIEEPPSPEFVEGIRNGSILPAPIEVFKIKDPDFDYEILDGRQRLSAYLTVNAERAKAKDELIKINVLVYPFTENDFEDIEIRIIGTNEGRRENTSAYRIKRATRFYKRLTVPEEMIYKTEEEAKAALWDPNSATGTLSTEGGSMDHDSAVDFLAQLFVVGKTVMARWLSIGLKLIPRGMRFVDSGQLPVNIAAKVAGFPPDKQASMLDRCYNVEAKDLNTKKLDVLTATRAPNKGRSASVDNSADSSKPANTLDPRLSQPSPEGSPDASPHVDKPEPGTDVEVKGHTRASPGAAEEKPEPEADTDTKPGTKQIQRWLKAIDQKVAIIKAEDKSDDRVAELDRMVNYAEAIQAILTGQKTKHFAKAVAESVDGDGKAAAGAKKNPKGAGKGHCAGCADATGETKHRDGCPDAPRLEE